MKNKSKSKIHLAQSNAIESYQFIIDFSRFIELSVIFF